MTRYPKSRCEAHNEVTTSEAVCIICMSERIEELDDFRVRVAKALGIPAEASDDQLIDAINRL